MGLRESSREDRSDNESARLSRDESIEKEHSGGKRNASIPGARSAGGWGANGRHSDAGRSARLMEPTDSARARATAARARRQGGATDSAAAYGGGNEVPYKRKMLLRAARGEIL